MNILNLSIPHFKVWVKKFCCLHTRYRNRSIMHLLVRFRRTKPALNSQPPEDRASALLTVCFHQPARSTGRSVLWVPCCDNVPYRFRRAFPPFLPYTALHPPEFEPELPPVKPLSLPRFQRPAPLLFLSLLRFPAPPLLLPLFRFPALPLLLPLFRLPALPLFLPLFRLSLIHI